MKNFDDARAARRAALELDFQIGGETFRALGTVRPEVLTAYEDLDPSEEGATETLRVVDELILELIEPEGRDRYRALRLRETDPLTVEDMQDVVAWLMEQQTGRPTGPSFDSTLVPGAPGTISTDGFSSPDAAEEPVPSISGVS